MLITVSKKLRTLEGAESCVRKCGGEGGRGVLSANTTAPYARGVSEAQGVLIEMQKAHFRHTSSSRG